MSKKEREKRNRKYRKLLERQEMLRKERIYQKAVRGN